MKKLFKTLVGVFIIVLSICLILSLLVIVPLAAIWSVNTLFGLGIAYTFLNWLAAYVLITIFGASPTNKMANILDK